MRPELSDIAIAGGGLAGLCLAIELKRAAPELSIVIVDRRADPAPDAAFKVGESSVEVGSHYFREIVGVADLLEEELPKFGLRFFFSRNGNTDITQRMELGPSRFFRFPSYQIDRGHFENALARRCRELGVDVRFESNVRDIRIDEHGGSHGLTLDDGSRIECRWLVDAAGRADLLKRRRDLIQKNAHDVNAVWFRIDASIDIDEWSDEVSYVDRVEPPRRLSTNHLMGDGYWVWIIPLVGGRTSVGVVADSTRVPFSEIHTFERAFAWLERHEPQLAARLRPHLSARLDVLVLKHYSRNGKHVFSPDRWFITGEAGMFSDPLYSPGSDFIGISNRMIADLILRDHAGEDVTERVAAHERTYASLHRTVLTIYQSQYPIMGNSRVMPLKILWDFAMYWGSVAILALNGKLIDPDFMEGIRDHLLEIAGLGFGMQRFLRRWDALDRGRDTPASGFVDYASMPFLEELNLTLMQPLDDAAILDRLAVNLQLTRDLDAEIRACGVAAIPALAPRSMPLVAPTTRHLEPAIRVLYPDLGSASARR